MKQEAGEAGEMNKELVSCQRYFAVIARNEAIQKTPLCWIASGFDLAMTMCRVAVDMTLETLNAQHPPNPLQRGNLNFEH